MPRISFLKEHFAEKEGFEPPEVLPSAVFKTVAIDHSAISPNIKRPLFFDGAKVELFFETKKYFCSFFCKKLQKYCMTVFYIRIIPP